MRIKKIITIVLSVVLGIPILLYILVNIFAGAGRKMADPMKLGNIEIPVQRTIMYNDSSVLQQQLINNWAKGKTEEWKENEKVNLKNSRTVLACLIAGKRVEEMNQYLMRQKATGNPGSPWLFNPTGDYDFTVMAFTPILYLFKDRPDVLFPETKAHLVKHILTIEGDKFTRNVPYMLMMEDSENHILMAESSRYLKNQWLWEEGEHSPEYDNKNNGLEENLKSFLEEIYTYGFYEFNSAPYLGYTYGALLNLDEFATGEIKALSRKILDRLNWQYALSSYKFKHFPPHRRRFGKDFKKNIDSDYHTVMLKVWASLYSDTLEFEKISRGKHHALWAAIMSYRPTDKIMEWTLEKPHQYFVKMGHGYNSCPEIYSGDKSYLLSSGGANQGKRSLIVAKPIMLFLDDDATEMEEAIHMFGPGKYFVEWNNTGVYEDFACTKGKVHIPKGKQAVLASDNWQIFAISEGVFLAAYSEKELGLLVIVRAGSAEKTLAKVLGENSDKKLLKTQFAHPNGNFIEYDLDSPKDKWVITKVNKKAVDREFDQWPFFDGNIDSIN